MILHQVDKKPGPCINHIATCTSTEPLSFHHRSLAKSSHQKPLVMRGFKLSIFFSYAYQAVELVWDASTKIIIIMFKCCISERNPKFFHVFFVVPPTQTPARCWGNSNVVNLMCVVGKWGETGLSLKDVGGWNPWSATLVLWEPWDFFLPTT